MIRLSELLFWLSLFVVFYSYCVYPVCLLILSRFIGRSVLRDETRFPSVGVLVPAHNEQNVIKRKIDTILSIDYPSEKLSVWVGSDCSSDATDEIVSSYNDSRVHLWRSPVRCGKTGILNQLAPCLDTEIIVFTDANTIHRPDSIRLMVRNFADPHVGGVAGQIEHLSSGGDEIAEKVYRRFESMQKLNEGKLHSTISAFGGFYAIRASLFRPIPSNAYSNDDVLIPMNIIRQGYRVVYEPESISDEDTTDDVRLEFRRRMRIGAGNFQAFSWLIDFLNPLKGWPFFCYISHKVTRWFSPWFFVSAILSCALLSWTHPLVLYRMIFAAGIVMACSGLLHKVVPLNITRHIFYFMAMNVALIFGFFRFLIGIKTAAWARTDRA